MRNQRLDPSPSLLFLKSIDNKPRSFQQLRKYDLAFNLPAAYTRQIVSDTHHMARLRAVLTPGLQNLVFTLMAFSFKGRRARGVCNHSYAHKAITD
jgi:hypothetical protein